MFNVWRASTTVFVLQLIVGALTYSATGEAAFSAIVVTALTFFVLSGLVGTLIPDDVHMVSLPSTLGSLVVFMAIIDARVGLVVAVVFAVLLTYLAAIVGQRGRREPGWMILVAMLPVGFGTAIGGVILLWRRRYTAAYIPFPFE